MIFLKAFLALLFVVIQILILTMPFLSPSVLARFTNNDRPENKKYLKFTLYCCWFCLTAFPLWYLLVIFPVWSRLFGDIHTLPTVTQCLLKISDFIKSHYAASFGLWILIAITFTQLSFYFINQNLKRTKFVSRTIMVMYFVMLVFLSFWTVISTIADYTYVP